VSKHDRLDPDVQRYLDGERVEDLDDSAREQADRLGAAIEAYTAGIEAPGGEVDRAVMAVVRSRGAASQDRSFWNWFLKPHAINVRPALAAAAAIALVVLGAAVVTLREPGAPAQLVAEDGTVLVRFELVAPDAQEVTLAGSFNDWSPQGIPLTRSGGTGLWTGTVALRPGEHQYLFVIDGATWIPDPNAHAQVDDGFGQENSVIIVGPRGVIRS
jgi:hypothetical protein